MFNKSVFLCLFSLVTVSVFGATPPTLHVCTVANFQDERLDNLINSANTYGINLHVAGMDQPYRNNFYKMFRMYEYLDKLPINDVVLFVDAFDVLILASGEEILNKFLEKKVPCIFSAERRLYPRDPVKDLKIEYPEATSSFRYLNSGGYIGYVSFIKLMIAEIIDNRYSIPFTRYRRLQSDQFHCHRYFVQNQRQILLDTKTEIFLTLSDVEKKELIISPKERTVYIRETDSKPMIVHGNGPGKFLYKEIAEKFFK